VWVSSETTYYNKSYHINYLAKFLYVFIIHVLHFSPKDIARNFFGGLEIPANPFPNKVIGRPKPLFPYKKNSVWQNDSMKSSGISQQSFAKHCGFRGKGKLTT